MFVFEKVFSFVLVFVSSFVWVSVSEMMFYLV